MPPSKSVTIQEVADLAKVSTKTVSRVINNEPNVQAETQNRVLQVIKQLRYRPNLSARSLAGDRSFLIGLFIENPGSYVSDFQTGVVARCREAGLHLMVEPWNAQDPNLANNVSTLLRQLRLEAVILLPPHCDNPVILEQLDEEGIPIVRIAPKIPRSDAPVVRMDDYAAARRLTAHLLDFGHQRIGFILGCPGHSATEQRYQGFADEMISRQVPIDKSLVYQGNFLFESGEIGAERLLSSDNPPTAIFASNDDMAVAVIAVAQKLGLKLPDDLSVVGFDDTPVSRMTWPQITTIRQPVMAMGRIATDLIVEHSPKRKGWPDPMPEILLDFEIVIRNSTAPPKPSKVK